MKQLLRSLVLFVLFSSPFFVRATLTVTIGSSSALSGCDSICSVFNTTISGCTGSYSTVWFFYNHATSVTDSSTLPFYCFTHLGVYDVSARVTCNATGEQAYVTNSNYVTVHNSPVINFTTSSPASDTILTCGPRNVCFLNRSNSDTAGCSFTWTWIISGPDGVHYLHTSSLCYTFTTPGNYTVSLQYFAASCGCFGSETKTNFIKIQAPATACFVNSGAATFCSTPAVASYDASCSSGATSYLWHFGDHSSATTTSPTTTHSFSSPGFYSDTLYAITSAGCRTMVYLDTDVFVTSFTAGMASARDTVCSGTTVTFADSSHIGGHAFGTSFYLYHGTTAVDSVLSATPVAFAFHYPAPDSAGLFRVTEVATDSLGCTSSASRNIYVRASPVISGITADTAYKCAPILIENFHSSVFPTSGLTYQWTYDDGLSTTGSGISAPTHTYTAIGTYRPNLKVTDIHGCFDSTNAGVNLKIGSIAMVTALSADSGCVTSTHPMHVDFFSSLATPFIPFIVDSVTFGDGTPACIGSQCVDSSHDYTVGGMQHIITYWHFPAYLGGCSYVDTAKILIGGTLPNGHISHYWMNGATRMPADSVCPNTVVIFNDQCTNCTYTAWSVHADGALYTSEGATADIDTTSALYGGGTGAGVGINYMAVVNMTVNGCTIADTDYVYVFKPATGTIVATTPNCAHRDSVRFQILGATGATAYSWSFGDAGTAATTGTSVIHRYTATPPHTYTVVVIDSGGAANHYCTNTDTLVYSTGTPALTWRISNLYPCKNEVDSFFGPTTADGTPFNDYFWLFGDGSPSVHTSLASDGLMDFQITHSFTRTGIFRDSVIVRNSSGCRDTAAVKTVTVIAPVGGLSVSDTLICVGSLVYFRDLNTDAYASIANPHHWTFNAGPMVTTSAIPSTALGVDGGHGYGTLHSGDTSLAFDTRGYFHIVLTDTDNHHCSSLDRALVHAVKPHAYFTSPDSAFQMCIGLSIPFTDTNTHCTYSWNYGDGTGWSTPSTSAQTSTHTYTANGTFTVKCAIFSDGSYGYPAGCSDTFTRVGYIRVAPLVLTSTNFGDDTLSSCPPLHVVRSADSAFNTYMWRVTPGIGTFPGPFIHTNIYANGHYNVTMIGTTAWGCTDSVTTRYTIGGPAGYMTVTPDSGCAPLAARLHFTDTGITSSSSYYIWNTCPHGAFTTTTPDTTIYYTGAGVFCAPTVTIQNGACAVTIPYNNVVTVFPRPVVTLTHLAPICYGHDTTLMASGADNYYYWRPSATDLSSYSSDSSSVSLHPTTTTTYTVTGVTLHGCHDTATTTVTVIPLPTVGSITGLTDVCIGATITVADAVSGGIWSRSNSYATITSGGVVTGISTGIDTIIYTVTGSGCTNRATRAISVNPPPSVDTISGPSSVCSGSVISLTDASTGGAWSTTNAIATVDVATGVVTGVTAGHDTVVYTITNVCGVAIAHYPINIVPSVLPAVTIYNPTDTFCALGPITLYANVTAGGASPYIEWRKFGVFVDTGYTYTMSPSYGDVIKCILYSDAQCRLLDSTNDVTTLHITMPFTPYVSIHASTDTIAYAGQIVTFTATTTYGGSSPTYQWFLNGGAISGATSNTCSVETYSNDTVYCIVYSSLPCVRPGDTVSNTIVVHTERLAVNTLSSGSSSISLYPNPNNSTFQISGKINVGASNSNIEYEISNISGETIYQAKIPANNGKINEYIELNNKIPDGIYILRIHSDTKSEILHFVVQR